ncbi:MAG: selenocysteine-specific translation elongation factor [Piscinibacter sp.]|nr:selenocysteine-specific translation elongation factor [Piscinibacter sp.]
MIVATAGHVDHGKTTLVRALTGVDTDRLPEEKRRGMTIEPGYAHADLGGAQPVAFVDVPGHGDFLRQAIVGLAAADAALLVVACDDGPMPQTREHLALLQLLGLRRGAIVLTKTDRVAPARVDEVAAAMRACLQGTALTGAPTLRVDATRGSGLAALRELLRQWQRDMQAPAANGGFRLAVDRVFTRAGIGTVATGTVLSGRVQTDAALTISPSGQPVRVRGIQVHGREAAAAQAGQRCALALAGLERAALARGDWLLDPALHAPTQRLDVQLHWLPGAQRALDGHADLQLHLGAAAVPARAVPLAPRRLAPGETGLVQLVLAAPVSALHGDRCVLRDPSAQALVGGARVLDAAAPSRGRGTAARLAELQVLIAAGDDAQAALAGLADLRPDGLAAADFARQWNLEADTLRGLIDAADAVRVATVTGERLLARRHWQALRSGLVDTLAAWHAEQPDSPGLTEPTLLAAPAAARDRALRRAALAAALQQGSIERAGYLLRRPGHQARLAEPDAVLLQRLQAVMTPFGLRPPPLGELAPLLDLPLREAADTFQRLARLGYLVQVARNRFFLPETVQALMQVARDTAAAAPEGGFDAASFRDRSGVGRNLSIQLLEFFDRIGLTRYRAERRCIVDNGEAAAAGAAGG